MKLFMVLLGCKPKGRHIEQHDIFFGIGEDLVSLLPSIIEYWPEAKGKMHVDAWREVNFVDGFLISVVEKAAQQIIVTDEDQHKLFFVNLGGYKANEFDEFHYKIMVAAPDLKTAQRKAMATSFFKHTSLPKSALHPKAGAHIDDKYGLDIDDIFAVTDILSAKEKKTYHIVLNPSTSTAEDDIHLGYFKLSDIK